MATFSDDFNRADGALGSNWTAPSGLSMPTIVSNRYTATSGSVRVAAVATATATFAADQEASVTVAVLGTNDLLGPAVRVDIAAGTGYCLRVDGLNSGGRRIYRFSGTTLVEIGSANVPCTAGDIVTLRAVNDTISAYVNGVLVNSITNALYASGQPGIFYDRQNSGASRGDSFSAQDVGAASVRRRDRSHRRPVRDRRVHRRSQTRILMGATLTEVLLPPDYLVPRNPTVRRGPTLTAAMRVAPTLNPTVIRSS